MLSVKIYRNLRRIFVMEYILTNFMLYVRGIFKNVTIYIWQYIHILHWYSVCGAFQLRVKKNPTFTWRTSIHDNCTDISVAFKIIGFFNTCMFHYFFFNLHFIYLYRCYTYIICFHFKGWPTRRIIHITSSVVLQNAENVMSNSNIF